MPRDPRQLGLRLPLVYYHGTGLTYRKPRRNGLGILWLADDLRVAQAYAVPHWRTSRAGYVWRITLKPRAKVVDLADLSNPIVRKAFDEVNTVARYKLGAYTPTYWRDRADFGLFETYRWLAGFFRAHHVDGVICRDVVSTSARPHRSLALVRPSAIESMIVQRVAA